MKEKKSFGEKIGSVIMIIGFLLIGAICGRYFGKMIAEYQPQYPMLALGIGLLEFYLAMYLQIVLHEGGHLVAGLMTGYKFSSFRIGSLMLMKEDGKLRFRRMSLAGTGGQCLMTPPDMEDGTFPVVFYNLGGSLMNLLVAAISAVLIFVTKDIPMLSGFFFMPLTVMGIGFALLNGIPARMGAVNNDGDNAVQICKNADARYAFWLQLKINEMTGKGMRLKDMPDEWFAMPEEEKLSNTMIATLAVFRENRFMDQQNFEEAKKLITYLLESDARILGLYRSLLISDLIYLELISPETDKAKVEELYTKELKKVMKQMKAFPSVIRTEYALALLFEKNKANADKVLAKFEKSKKSYPYAGDLESEAELIQIATHRAGAEQETAATESETAESKEDEEIQ